MVGVAGWFCNPFGVPAGDPCPRLRIPVADMTIGSRSHTGRREGTTHMRDGFKVFDADTHFQPSVESILPYLDPELRAREKEFERFLSPVKTGRAGQKLEPPFRHWYSFADRSGWGREQRRHLGEAAPRENEERRFQQFMGSRHPALGAEDYDVDVRIREMDEEGVDVELMVPGAFGGHEDPAVNMGLIRAAHRFQDETCSRYPDRLRSLIHVDGSAIEESVAEIHTWGKSKWARGIITKLPLDMPIDHPDLDPVWAAASEHNLCVVHHSTSTGYPGFRDLWANPFLGRTAGHPWGAMRVVAAFLGAGLFDRFPDIRLSILESGFGWLPFWMKRMEDQIVYMGYVAEDLQHSMTEYMTGGRFFASIVLHEGEDMVHMVNELMGDGVLMFGSDYPHAESRFPDSVDLVVAWNKLGVAEKRRLFWDNAAACYAE